MDGWIGGWMDRWMDGWWIGGWMDRWMDGYAVFMCCHVKSTFLIFALVFSSFFLH